MKTADRSEIERDVRRIICSANPAAFGRLDWLQRLALRVRTAVLLMRVGTGARRAWLIAGMAARYGSPP